MAKCFTSWTVLPHQPLEKHSEDLWSVSGKMPGGNQRRMTIARRADGKLVIHNAIALGDAEMKQIEAWGEPAYMIVPNGFHRMDSVIYKQRYPKLDVLCPQAARKKVSELVPVAGHLEEMPRDAKVELFHLRGMKQREGALRIKSGSTASVVFNDTLLNLAPTGGVAGFFMAPTGTLSVPRFSSWMMLKSAAELKEHLNELARTPGLTHVVPGHGDVVATEPGAQLQQAAARL
jgi:hypothetical protein